MTLSRPVRRYLPMAIATLVLFAGLLSPDALRGASSKKVDINSASQAELEALPGVGEATAKKIIAGRPYGSVADLSKAGVSDSTIQKISGMVKAGRSSAKSKASDAAASAPAAASKKSEKADKPAKTEKAEKSQKAQPSEKSQPAEKTSATAAKAAPSGSQVDLNTASQKELEALPGVGEVTAKKIIAGRPYFSVAEVSRAGVSSGTMSKISKLVYVSAPITTSRSTSTTTSSSSAPAPSSSAAPPASSSRPAPKADSSAEAPYQAPPSPGMVWVNLDTKIFHRQGDHWYGKTKHGQYMNEADAVKAGYRLSREKGEPGAQ